MLLFVYYFGVWREGLSCDVSSESWGFGNSALSQSKVFLANVFKRNAFSKHFTKTSIVAPLLSWSEQTLSCQQRFKCISVQVNYYLTNICPHWWVLDECISLFCSVVFIIVEYLFLMQICFVMLIIVFFWVHIYCASLVLLSGGTEFIHYFFCLSIIFC